MSDFVQEHFDRMAGDYDFWKKKNRYYYDAVKRMYAGLIPPKKRILEIGCGTGDILASLHPSFGTGIDVSGGMIARAQQKYADAKNMSFQRADAVDAASFSSSEPFDFIFLADVIEHLSDAPSAIRSVARLMRPETTLIVSMANPLWEPALMLAEKLKLKMPEGPHIRISAHELITLCGDAGLRLVKRDYKLLFPKYVPVFSWLVNAVGEKIPLLRRLGVITVFVFRRRQSQ